MKKLSFLLVLVLLLSMVYFPQGVEAAGEIVETQSNKGFVAISAGDKHTLGLKVDKSLWGWGENASYQLTIDASPMEMIWIYTIGYPGAIPDNRNMPVTEPKKIMDNVISFDAVKDFSAAVTTDGILYAWGFNNITLSDISTSEKVYRQPKALSNNVKLVCLSPTNAYIIKEDNTLWGAGKNECGQLGNGEYDSFSEQFVKIASDVTEVDAGYNYVLFKKKDGSLWGTGDDSAGQLGQGAVINKNIKDHGFITASGQMFSGMPWVLKPVKISSGGIKSFLAGHQNSYIINNDNSLWIAGSHSAIMNNYPNLKLGGGGDCAVTHQQIMTDVDKVADNYGDVFILRENNTLWRSGYFDMATQSIQIEPKQIYTDTNNIAHVYAFLGNHFLLKSDGSFVGGGSNDAYQLGLGNDNVYKPANKVMDNVKSVYMSSYTAYVIKNDNSLWTWGLNFDDTLLTTPTEIASDVRKVISDGPNVFILKTDDTVWYMGNSDSTYLEIKTSDKIVRKPIKITSDVKDISLSLGGLFALKNDGSLYAAGGNRFCMNLVPNNTLGKTELTELTKVYSDVKAISSNSRNTMFTDNNNNLYVYGNNTSCELGGVPMDTICDSKPHFIAKDVKFFTSEGAGLFYIDNGGSLYGWGRNDNINVGYLSSIVETPTKVLDQVRKVSSVFGHTMAIKEDGTLWAVGMNNAGQLGTGDFNDVTEYRQIMDNVLDVATSYQNTLILKDDGTVWALGSNARGQRCLSEGASTPYLPMKFK